LGRERLFRFYVNKEHNNVCECKTKVDQRQKLAKQVDCEWIESGSVSKGTIAAKEYW